MTVGEYYHIYNRGVDKRNIVLDEDDSERFVQGLVEFNAIDPIGSLYLRSFAKDREKSEPLVNIVSYCLNPNHFHLILEQLMEGGISLFMSKHIGGYVRYFNEKYKRGGPLLQGPFKAKHIGDNDYLLHSSAYVNLNDRVHQLSTLGTKLVRSSWKEYTERAVPKICKREVLVEQFAEENGYSKFCMDNLPLMLEKRAGYKELAELFRE
jgi:putative transposase